MQHLKDFLDSRFARMNESFERVEIGLDSLKVFPGLFSYKTSDNKIGSGSGNIKKILSWDCGIKSSSWTYFSFRENIPSIISQGTIDFLDGQMFDDVSPNDWTRRIREGLRKFAPGVSNDTTICIEIQPQNHRGRISSANAATQYCISYWYSDNPIRFIHAREKNKIGIIPMSSLTRVMSGETLRKGHTRMNFDLFVFLMYGRVIKKEKKNGVFKLRDVADSFMQGIAYHKIQSPKNLRFLR